MSSLICFYPTCQSQWIILRKKENIGFTLIPNVTSQKQPEMAVSDKSCVGEAKEMQAL
ncbi:MAG: hypothetical protein P8Y47_05725 [Alphaproteobacteria bacterium]|jgi:hypothetical protein